MPLAFRISETTDPKPRTFLLAVLGERGVGGAVHPHNWSDAIPKPPFLWAWRFSIGPWKWNKPEGSTDTREEAEARLAEAYAAFLDKFGLQEGAGGPPRVGSLTLRSESLNGPARRRYDFDILHSGEILGRLTYPDAQPARWGWNVWLEPPLGGLNGLAETKEEAMSGIRGAWTRWLAHMGLSERL